MNKISFVTAHWSTDALHGVAWSPELELGVWVRSEPHHERKQQRHCFAAAAPGAISFMGHPDAPTEQRLSRFTTIYQGNELQSFTALSDLLAATAHSGYGKVRLGPGNSLPINSLRMDRDRLDALCRRDADCGTAWGDHAWLLVRPGGDDQAQVFHFNLNSGQIVPPTPLLLQR